MAQKKKSRPLLNAVLLLKRRPIPEVVSGMSSGEAGIKHDRLSDQRLSLYRSVDKISRERKVLTHAGKLHIFVRMFSDSLAPSWTPHALLGRDCGTEIVAPARCGYVVEATHSALGKLAERIRTADSIEARAAISRIERITKFGKEQVLNDRRVGSIWKSALVSENGRFFSIWLLPFKDADARTSVIGTLEGLRESKIFRSTFPAFDLSNDPDESKRLMAATTAAGLSSLARAAREYRRQSHARLIVEVGTCEALKKLISSGTIHRVDPIRPFQSAELTHGRDPDRPVPKPGGHPVVGIVDGGCHAKSYLPMEAWRAQSLIADVDADTSHGNRVTSLVVHGHAWNPKLELPQLECQFGTVQAIAKLGRDPNSRTRFIEYLRQVVSQYAQNCRVWNMSFNECGAVGDDCVSELGHELRKIAREYAVLPVVSIGNRAKGDSSQLASPADCEAAITVAGRQADPNGKVSSHCSVSRTGLGPDGMWKPDLAWFSKVRSVGGGAPLCGSSFASPFVSSLAAHAFHNLKAPTPDLVKALLINSADCNSHDPRIGWGTPSHDPPPWVCDEGSVTLTWTEKLRPGYWYYWNDIPIPPEMVSEGKLKGFAALTAVLNPLVSEMGGPNYFATRVQVALQYQRPDKKYKNLLGSMKEGTDPEIEARRELAKWHPVRRHVRSFPRGVSFAGGKLRLAARIFTRDLYQFDYSDHHEVPPQEVAFVLSLRCDSRDDSIYESMVGQLGNYVESAVINQEVDVEY